MSQAQKVKTPIFIGCNDPEIIKGIESHVVMTEAEKYELVVINPSIQERLQYQYLLALLSEENRRQVIEKSSDNAKREEARKTAEQLRNVIEAVFHENYAFDRADVKVAVQKTNGKISTNEVANLMEFLIMYSYIQPLDLEEKAHKRKYRFNFTPEESLNNVIAMQNSLSEKIDMMNIHYGQLEDNKTALLKEIEGNTEIVMEKSDKVEEPVKKKRGRPKKERPTDPGEHDYDCRCLDCKDYGKTETEKHLETETKKSNK